jgi:hypothetical protein
LAIFLYQQRLELEETGLLNTNEHYNTGQKGFKTFAQLNGAVTDFSRIFFLFSTNTKLELKYHRHSIPLHHLAELLPI